ncbi:MAG: multicopper oxidase domain-containing protein [Gammaproteobacteria bacterium]|nr:multicopper oxidase domain-containing protein [Gammaproteobacteria bacterium]
MSLTLSRRRFLAGSAALLGAGCFQPSWSNAKPPGLPIPALVDGTGGKPVDLRIRGGEWSFKPGVRTPTLGFNQDYLGPTIRTRQNSELNLRYRNTLAEGVAVHGHGLHVPGDVDGGPQREIAPGDRWGPALSIVQPAATCWYHAHTHGRTGHQVYHGLAGLIIIDDDVSDSMDLPRQYGVDDLPVIIQDRTFDAQGRLVYSLNDAGEDGWLGETVVINGAINPVVRVPAGKVRLRLLNGANARFYLVGFADSRTFHKIATDGGFLESPVPLTIIEMAPGERCEIIVDMADGNTAELLTLFEDEFDDDDDDDDGDDGMEGIFRSLLDMLGRTADSVPQASLTLKVDGTLPAQTAPLPERMVAIARPRENEIMRTRDFMLTMEDDDGGHGKQEGHAMMDMNINGAAMDMGVINERVKLGVWECWRIRSNQGAHPFHVHGCSFLIEEMEGEAAPSDQRGWKDTVVVDDDDWAEIVVRFDHPATVRFPYMFHCHILEHEDRGMMGQFTVT